MALMLTILTYLATVITLAVGALYLFFKRKYNYWKSKNVPHTSPKMPLGDLRLDQSISELSKSLYESHSKERFFGFWFFYKPNLMVNDPELLKRILVQDFTTFPDHGTYVNEKDDPLANNLFSMHGSQWRNLRAKMSPTFSSGKMKSMFPIIDEISKTMQKVVDPLAAAENVVDIKDLAGRYTTDVIASCAYGIDVNSLENPDSIFRTMGKRIFQATWQNKLRNTINFMAPDIAGFFKLVQTDKELSKFFLQVVKDTLNYREKNNVQRNDFMDTLLQLKNKGFIEDIDDKNGKGDLFTVELAAAQAFVFFAGGFETTAGALQFVMYELAKNQDIQDRVRNEILDDLKKREGKMTYEGIFSLKYLGMVMDESQRKYPQAAILMREALKDYPIPDSDVVIEKGTQVYFSPFGLHHDPRYYKNPEKFDPERFTDEEKAKRHHYVYLPFGEGPRFCIGQRFAQMQMRAGLYTLLSKYKFEPCEKTPETISIDPKTFILTPVGGVHLKISLI